MSETTDATPVPGPETAEALRQLHSDPFVQGALWRVWVFGMGLLEPSASRLITMAYAQDKLSEDASRT